MHKDSHVNSLELSLTQKNDEIEKIEEKINRFKQQQQFSSTQFDTNKKQVQILQKDLQSKDTQLTETLNELNIIKDIVSNFELQKDEMMNKLEQQQQVFDDVQTKYEQKIKQQEQQLEKNTSTDNQLSRISELEDALRQSVAITAEREIVMAKQKAKLEKTEHEV
jgi:ELKS/RAB6-interacting/CAST family protein 1